MDKYKVKVKNSDSRPIAYLGNCLEFLCLAMLNENKPVYIVDGSLPESLSEIFNNEINKGLDF